MSYKLTSYTSPPPRPVRPGIPRWEDDDSDSRSLMPIIPLYFICSFVIYFLLEITLIPLLVASRWLVLFGAVSFLLLYAFRGRLRLDLTDGLILSIFGIAPLLMAGILTVNWYFSTPVEETYDIIDLISDGQTIEVELADGAYDEFYRLRVFDVGEAGRSKRITFYFGDGALGWKVKRGHEWR